MPRTGAGVGSPALSRRRLLAALGSAFAVRPARAAGAVVEIRRFAFAPAEIEIAAGESVTFVNLDVAPHTATGESFDSGMLRKGERKAVAFPTAGTFDYLCSFHRQMRGRVAVR